MAKIIQFPIKKAGYTRTLCSPTEGLRELNKPRHYGDTIHDYGNIFEFRRRPSALDKNNT